MIVVEVCVAGAAACFLLGSGIWQRHRTGADERRLAQARLQVQRFLAGECDRRKFLAMLSRLRFAVLVSLFQELEITLKGQHRRELTEIAASLGLVKRAARMCRSRRWWRRLHGARVLTLVGADHPVMPRLLRDPHVEVRSQAAEWAADHPTPQVITALLELLSDTTGLCRFTVQDTLLRIGHAVVEPLAAFLGTHSGSQVTAALMVSTGLADRRLLPCALAHCADADEDTRAAAVEVLGTLGGDEAIAQLLSALQDPSPLVRANAARGLGSLKHWPAAPRVVELLRDAVWEVRRDAGLALWNFGAPGTLMLRRALHDRDRFAADMARQVLCAPELGGVEQ